VLTKAKLVGDLLVSETLSCCFGNRSLSLSEIPDLINAITRRNALKRLEQIPNFGVAGPNLPTANTLYAFNEFRKRFCPAEYASGAIAKRSYNSFTLTGFVEDYKVNAGMMRINGARELNTLSRIGIEFRAYDRDIWLTSNDDEREVVRSSKRNHFESIISCQ